MTARSRVLFFPDGRRVEVDPDYSPPPRPRIAIQGVKEPFQSMADGRYYDDTRTYEREVRARGYEVVGNEKAKPYSQTIQQDDPTIRDDLIETAREMEWSIEGRFADDA